MTPRWPRLALCALIVLSSPGSPARQAFAAGGQTWDPKKGKMVSPDDAESATPDAEAAEAGAGSADAVAAAPGSAAALIQALRSNPNIGADQRLQAVDYLKRYGSALDNGDEETRRALEDAAKQLKDRKLEPSLALAHMFEGTSTAARQAEQAGNVTQILKETSDKTVGRVISTVAGKTIYEFENNKVDTDTTLQVIRKPDPKHPGEQTVETIIQEQVKGAATDKRVLYNRRLHDLMRNLKKLYYDQCGLVRKINNGELRIADSKCGDNSKEEVLGHHDPELTEEAREKIQALYEKNRRAFPKKLADYLDKLDSLRKSGQLASLKDWKEAEEMQRLAMGFYQDHQLAEYQRIVIQELVQYFSSATGVQAKQKKGDDAVDRTAKKIEEFQEQLDDYKRGDMEGYGVLMKIIGYTKLDENDRKYVTPAVLSFASEAFASVAFAARAQEQLLSPKAHLTGPEQDALIEQAGNWMKLAQMQIQAFAMNMQAMELHRLADGRLSGGMGISVDDKRMIERAEKLADVIDKQYAPALAEGNRDMKRMLLRQTVSAFETTYRAATEQYLYDDTEHERLQLLGGKAGEMLSLYLAAQFDQYRTRPEYTQTFSAAEKAQAGAYKYFLDHLPPEVAAVTRDLELFKRRLDGLAPLQSVEAIREGLKPLHEEFARLVKVITGEDIPKTDDLKKESDKQAMANGRLLSAVSSFSNKAQMFSYLNQLNLYVDQYASSNLVWSRSDTFWTQAAKFKWLDAAFNKITFGYREDMVNFVMGSGLMGVVRPKWHEAYMKLKADTGMRHELEEAMRGGDDKKMMEIAAKLDREAAERAVRMAKLDKLDQDPSDSLNLDGLLSKQYDNDLQAAAFGATVARFKLLQPLMTSYAASSALVDTGISIAYTAIGGPMIAYLSDIPARLNKVALSWKANGLKALENAKIEAKLLGGTQYLAGLGLDVATDNFATRVLQNTGRSFRQHLDLPTGVEERQSKPLMVAVRQIRSKRTWLNSLNATYQQVKMMGFIQVGMTEFDYMTTPASAQSQYSSAWDAAVQGFFQGLAFGGKMAVMNHFSPFPATAFQGRFIGRFGIGGFVRKLAESPGPASWAIQSIAQTIPATAESLVAKQGVFGALQSAGMTAGAGANFAARFGVHILGQVDGMLKYIWLAGTLPKAVSEVGYMFSSDKDWKTGWTGAAVGAVAAGGAALVGSLVFRGMGRVVALPLALAGGLGGFLATVQNKPTTDTLVNPRTGLTGYMTRLSDTHFVSQNISQLAWLLLPTNPAFSPSEMRSQINSAKAFNALIAEGRGMEIANAPNDYPLTIEKDLSKRGLWDMITRKPTTDTLIVNEQWRAQAWEHEMKRMSESELLAIAEAPLKEGAGQILELRDYLDGARDPEAFKKRLEENVANPSRDKAISVEIKVGGKWERVDLSDPGARARWVPGAAPGDGYVEVKHPRTGDWVRVGTDAETPLARPVFGGRPDQVRLSIESVAAARTELERRLTDKPELREKLLLTADSGRLVLPGGLEVSGDRLGTLRETAARIEVTKLPFSLTPSEFFSRFGRAGWTDGKLDGQMERIGRILRDHVSGETARLARSSERFGELGEQARQMADTVKLKEDRALFREVADALLADRPDPKAAREALEKGVAAKLALGEKAEGVPARSLQIMLRGLNGEQTADLMTMAAHRVMAKQMGEGGAALDDALNALDRELDKRDKKAGPPTVDDVYKIALDALSAKGLREAAPQAADRLLKGLEADRAALKDPKSGKALVEAVQRRLLAESGAADVALGLLRKSLEGDAVRQAVAQRGLEAARNGDEKAIGESIDLLLDVWERGVFGQLVGERALVKDKDGKEELQWTIPKEVAFYNRFKQSIPSFRALQREVLREGLMLVMRGHPLVFGQMPTAGGKTLTMFVAIEYLKADARNKGRENVILLTTNPDLIAQAKDDYLGFFGKKPDFEIMTVGDLSAQIAQAKAQGMPDPTLKNHLVIDEADKYAAEVPTSVGVFNGAMTMPDINPVLKALTKETRYFVDDPKGFFARHYDSADGHVREGRFAELMAKDPKFKAHFEAAVQRAEARVDEAFEHMKSRAFRDELAAPGPDSPLSKAPEYLVAAEGDRQKAAAEIQKILVAEFKHARSSGISLYGSYEKDLSLMFQGAFQWASSPEKEMVGIADNTVKNGSVISFNNGAAYSNLSTLENRAIASYFGKSIKNPFKTAGVLNYRGLIEAAKNSGAVVFAVSGTSAAPIREVFIRQFGFNFIGEVSVADPYKPRLLKPGVDWVDVEGTRKFVHAGLDVKDHVIPEYVQFLRRNEEGKVVAKTPAEVYADLDKVFSQAAAKAKDPSRVAVVLRPDVAELFKTYSKDFKGFQEPDLAKLERNKAAFEKGQYDELILVGGPNMVFKFAPTLGTGEHMQKVLGKATKSERISIQTYPGMQLKVQERGDVRALAEKNQASLERGDAEITGLIGYAGLRGLEVYLNLYAGRTVRMDILDPQALPTEELTQLVGRLAYGRAGMLRERVFQGIVRPEEFVKSTSLPEAMRDSLVQTLRDDLRGDGELAAAEALLKSGDIAKTVEKLLKKGVIKQDVADRAALLKPEEIVRAVAARDAARDSWDGRGNGVSVKDDVWMDILLPTLKDPNNLEANNLMTRISETLKLRGKEGLSDAERAEVLKLADAGLKPGMSNAEKLQALKASNAALAKFLGDHPEVLARKGVLETLISAMGRIEQESALSTSGVVGEKKGNATPINQREMKPGGPAASRSPLAPGAAPIPGMVMPAPVGP